MQPIVIASDRDEDTQRLLHALEQAGYPVSLCMETQNLIERITALEPDIVFIDPDLSDGEGVRLAARLHVQSCFRSLILIFLLPKGSSMPDFLTGFSPERIGWLTRPFGNGEVLAFIDHILRKRGKT